MATKTNSGAACGSTTVTVTKKEKPATVLKIRQHKEPKETAKAKGKRSIQWDETAVDNEHMGKKSSKCCCVYSKPRAFDESSSDDSDADEETKHRRKFHGTAEKKKEPCCSGSH